ncbi:YcxB family protein [Streptomyces antimicrobicus]|uniref:YcxB family protein n=1 Tax=Streptomyces antimicrobicus TaxID=2883108 RepID=A0ABS8B0L3_9ACTN|nr:YcxB family protein [Streptomyces antimicrobicus]MCB5178145.1 YcxB family protein [Streptomyces antimicrobicus]
MHMNETEPAAAAGAGTGDGVELVYEVTTADLARAIRVRARATPALRRERWLLPLLGGSSVLIGGGALLAGRTTAKSVLFLALGLLLCALMLIGPRLQARAFAGMLAKAGRTRTVVDGSGITVLTQQYATRMEWTAQPAYAETDELFLTLDLDKRAASMTILPKRGLRAPEDADRLRELLDANLRRI